MAGCLKKSGITSAAPGFGVSVSIGMIPWRTPSTGSSSPLRLAAGLGIAAAGLVAVLPHPTAGLWMASIVLSEGGYWLALLASPLVVDLRAWRGSEDGRPAPRILAATAALAGIVLLLSPVAGAYAVARTLPDLLEARFGTPVRAPLAEPPRPAPVSLPALLAGVRAGKVVAEEHVYAVREEDDLRLDLYRPVLAQGALPVVVMIHGGGWSTGDKRDFPALNDYLAARGYVVAAIGYRPPSRRTVPGRPGRRCGSHPPISARWPRRTTSTRTASPSSGVPPAARSRFSPGTPPGARRFAASSPSTRRPRSVGATRTPPKPGVIDSSAVLDAYLGGPPATHGAQYDAAEPARFVSASTPPTLFIQGLRDEHVSPFHAEFVSARLLEAGVPHALVRLPWATHGCDYLFRGPCGQVSTFAVEWFLDAVLRREQ